MKLPNKDELSKRWTKDKIALVDRALASPIPDLNKLKAAFGLIEKNGSELIDLRCFPFFKNYSDRMVKQIDFELCVWQPTTGVSPIDATGCNFAQCTLDGALNKRFESCDFCSARLIETVSTPGTTFLNCDFRGVSFRSGSFLQCIFENCSFVSAKVRNTEFDECSFDLCDFTDCTFKGCSFGGSQFRRPKNNFRFNRYVNDSIELTEKIFSPKFEMVDLKDTLMGKVKFC